MVNEIKAVFSGWDDCWSNLYAEVSHSCILLDNILY